MIKLQENSIDKEEILELMDSLLSGNVSMGKKNNEFEKKWAYWLNSRYASSANSGSSANLLILSALRSPLFQADINDGDEIIVPAVSWSTTFFPIQQNNLVCRLVDVDTKTFNIDVNKIEQSINEKTKAIMIVHLIGSSCNMDKIMDLCVKYNIALIEDCCEAAGAKWDGQKVGTFGLASSFSFMFAHHICTVEGSCINSDNELFNNILKIKRAHGWIKDIQNKQMKDNFISSNKEIDHRYLFVDTGYNMRMNDLQASLGIHQIDRLNGFIEIRRKNHFYLINKIKEEGLDKYIDVLEETEKQWLSPFSFPMIAKTIEIKNKLINKFEENGIETRGISAGNITRQPFIKYYKDYFKFNDLTNANIIHDKGFWIGNHQNVSIEDYENVVKLMKEVLC